MDDVEQRKLAKKAKKEKRHDNDNKTENSKNKRSLESSDDDNNHRDAPSAKRMKVDDVQRRRTRSMSDAEENFHLKDGLTPDEFRKEHQITITGSHASGSGPFNCPDPMTSFKETPFAPPIRKALENAGFSNPTPTQAQSWPIALDGRDIITVARTGSGKTCGFLLPAFHRLLSTPNRKKGAPGILVLAPTRELACQIEEEAIKFGRTSNIRSACAYGGSPKGLQIRKIQAGLEVLIATPGRLNDLIEMRVIDLSQVLFLVLDEADRM